MKTCLKDWQAGKHQYSHPTDGFIFANVCCQPINHPGSNTPGGYGGQSHDPFAVAKNCSKDINHPGDERRVVEITQTGMLRQHPVVSFIRVRRKVEKPEQVTDKKCYQ